MCITAASLLQSLIASSWCAFELASLYLNTASSNKVSQSFLYDKKNPSRIKNVSGFNAVELSFYLACSQHLNHFTVIVNS